MDSGILGRLGDTQINGTSRRVSQPVHGVRCWKGQMEQEREDLECLARIPELFPLGYKEPWKVWESGQQHGKQGNDENKLIGGFL